MRFEIAAAHVNHGACVRQPLELRDLLPVVCLEVRHPPAFVVRPLGNPEIALPTLINDPGDLAALLRRRQFGRKGRTHHLFEREPLLAGG